jgi:hypothetical protein
LQAKRLFNTIAAMDEYEPQAPEWWLEEQRQEREKYATIEATKTAASQERKQKIYAALRVTGKLFVAVLALIAGFFLFTLAIGEGMSSRSRRR